MAVKLRPIAGSTPSVWNKSQEHCEARTFSGSCPPALDKLYSGQVRTIAKSENPWFSFFHSRNTPPAASLYGNLSSALCSYSRSSRPGSLKGSGFNSTDRTTVNRATLAPMPMAITRIEMNAKPGVLHSVRILIRIF